MVDVDKVQLAIKIYLLCPKRCPVVVEGKDEIALMTAKKALHAAGLDETQANTSLPFFDSFLGLTLKSDGVPVLGEDDKSKVNRTVKLFNLCNCQPHVRPFQVKKIPGMMKFAGFAPSLCHGDGTFYKRCQRVIYPKDKKKPPPQPPPSINVVETEHGNEPNVSPLTTGSNTGFGTTAPSVASSLASSSAAPSLASSSETSSSAASTHATTKEQKASAVSKASGRPVLRKTAKQARTAKKDAATAAEIRKFAFKAGTFVEHAAQNNKSVRKLEGFRSKDQVADSINKMVGCHLDDGSLVDFVSGRELAVAVKEDRVGVSPLKRGRKSEVPEPEYKAMRLLSFSAQAIEQSNAVNRTTRTEMISLLGALVNSGKNADGVQFDLDDRTFYARTEKDNALRQTLGGIDPRDHNRVKWCNYDDQKKHYVSWEWWCEYLGFARKATEEEKRNKGVEIEYTGARRILQLDECCFTMNAADEVAGGRPQTVLNADGVAETGSSRFKTGEKCTILFCVTMADEALPPLFIFPTSAQKTVSVKADLILGMKQILCKAGYPTEHAHSPYIAFNGNGSMDGDIWADFILAYVQDLFPDVKDVSGHRVLIKGDSGPGRGLGRKSEDWWASFRSSGIWFKSGLPNGTELGQELDQCFGGEKTIAYRNRLALDKAGVPLRIDLVGYCIFGGQYKLPNGETLELKDAFSLGLSKDKIKNARIKCGYVPATRAVLKSPRLRHTVVTTPDGEIDLTADPEGALLHQLELDNKSAADELLASPCGFSPDAINALRRSVNRITRDGAAELASLTLPNTQERIDMLEELDPRRPGQLFKYTRGGTPLTCDDLLFAREKKNQKIRLQQLEKKKEACEGFQVAADNYGHLDLTKPLDDRTNDELKHFIRFKQGMAPPKGEAVSNKAKARLIALYNKYKDKEDPVDWQWTEQDQADYERLERGELPPLAETAIFQSGVQKNIDCFAIRARTIPHGYRMRALQQLRDLPKTELLELGRGFLALAAESAPDSDAEDGGSIGSNQDNLSAVGSNDGDRGVDPIMDADERTVGSGEEDESTVESLSVGDDNDDAGGSSTEDDEDDAESSDSGADSDGDSSVDSNAAEDAEDVGPNVSYVDSNGTVAEEEEEDAGPNVSDADSNGTVAEDADGNDLEAEAADAADAVADEDATAGSSDGNESGADAPIEFEYRTTTRKLKQNADGSFNKPSGSKPKGYEWSPLSGRWKKPKDS